MPDYRDFFEPSAEKRAGSTVESSRNYYFGKIKVTKSVFPDGSTCFTDLLRVPLFDNLPLKRRLVGLLSEQLSTYFKKYGVDSSSLVLVAGIGNENITSDSFGCKVCDGLVCTAHDYGRKSLHGNLASVKCGIAGISGIESYLHLTALKNALRPKIIVVVDTLSSSSVARLSSAIQISDRGISPGKGVGNEKHTMSTDTLDVPTVAIGVPLVIYAKRIIAECLSDLAVIPTVPNEISDLIVTAKDVDFNVVDFASVVADAINNSVHYGER